MCDEGAYLFARQTGPPASAPTTASAYAQGSASASASRSSAWGAVAGTTGEERAEQKEAGCRIVTYTQAKSMSQQEANGLSDEVVDRMSRKMQDEPSLTVGPAENAALDDMGVPRYPKCEMGGE